MPQIDLDTSSFTSRLQQLLCIFGGAIFVTLIVYLAPWLFSITFGGATFIVWCLVYRLDIGKMVQRRGANRVAHVARPAARLPPPPPACSSGTMTTLLSRVKWFDSAKGFGCAAPNEPGHPDVFLTDAVLRAAGVVNPKRGTSLVLTFDASHPKPRALVVRGFWLA
jgi:cold shock CspA family protein